ncbi:MAG TPA: hypothetical protein VNA15_08380 [Candidatus Angelobacter sp.]|nr:hypothetical protein [Candidatus Angelobacter sp.]
MLPKIETAHDFISQRHCTNCQQAYNLGWASWKRKFDGSENTRRIDICRLSGIHFQIQKNPKGTFTVRPRLVRAAKICWYDSCGKVLSKSESRKVVNFLSGFRKISRLSRTKLKARMLEPQFRTVPIPRIVMRFPWFTPSEHTGMADSAMFEKYEKVSCRHETFDYLEMAEMLAYDFRPPCRCKFTTKMRVSFSSFSQQIAYCNKHREYLEYERGISLAHAVLEDQRETVLEKSKEREAKEDLRKEMLEISETTDAFLAETDALEKEALARLGIDRSVIDAEMAKLAEHDREIKECEKQEREKFKNQYNGGYENWATACNKCELCLHRSKYYKRPIIDHCHCKILGGHCEHCEPSLEEMQHPREPSENLDGTTQTIIGDTD